MSRLDDKSGGDVYIDLLDKNGTDAPLALVTDYLTAPGDESIRLMASYDPYGSDDLDTVFKWDKEEIEAGEAPEEPEPEKKPYSVTFSTTIGVDAASSLREAIEIAQENLKGLDAKKVEDMFEVAQIDDENGRTVLQ